MTGKSSEDSGDKADKPEKRMGEIDRSKFQNTKQDVPLNKPKKAAKQNILDDDIDLGGGDDDFDFDFSDKDDEEEVATLDLSIRKKKSKFTYRLLMTNTGMKFLMFSYDVVNSRGVPRLLKLIFFRSRCPNEMIFG